MPSASMRRRTSLISSSRPSAETKRSRSVAAFGANDFLLFLGAGAQILKRAKAPLLAPVVGAGAEAGFLRRPHALQRRLWHRRPPPRSRAAAARPGSRADDAHARQPHADEPVGQPETRTPRRGRRRA